jgi:hypothetical protein
VFGEHSQAQHGSFLRDRQRGRQSGAGSAVRFKFRSLKPKVKSLKFSLNRFRAVTVTPAEKAQQGGRGGKIFTGTEPSNRVGPHTHKISCGRTIDFFKQQSKKSKEITGGRQNWNGVGGLITGWPTPTNPPPSYARIFFPLGQIFKRHFKLGVLVRQPPTSERRVRSVASTAAFLSWRWHRALNRPFIFSRTESPADGQKNRREIQGGGRVVVAPLRGWL